jgi:hypothetical protein
MLSGNVPASPLPTIPVMRAGSMPVTSFPLVSHAVAVAAAASPAAGGMLNNRFPADDANYFESNV